MAYAQETLCAMGEYMDGEGEFELGCSTNALFPRGLCGWVFPGGSGPCESMWTETYPG